MKRLVLCGGGHSHLEVLRRFGRRPVPGLELILVDPARHAAYSGMLPGLISGHYEFKDAHVDLERLAGYAGARRLATAALGIDPRARALRLSEGAPLYYDVLSLDIGSVLSESIVEESGSLALRARPAGAFLLAWDKLRERVSAGAISNLLVVGGGAAGMEVLLAMRHRLVSEQPLARLEFSLASNSDQLLPGYPARVREFFTRLLASRGVALHLSTEITRIGSGAAWSARGARIAADAVVIATGAAAPPVLDTPGLERDARGFFAVTDTLQSHNRSDVFAAGDCAGFAGLRVPKSGVYAVRQGPVLVENLRAVLAGRAPQSRFNPQALTLNLISAGGRRAVATRGSWSASGRWVWRWKDWIDRRFMARYRI